MVGVIHYYQAIIIGLVQGVTELFPISSLGHSILIADLFNWQNLVTQQNDKTSLFLNFLIGLHVATAIALFIFYRKTWYKLFKGFKDSVKNRSIKTVNQKLAWLLIVATIPAALIAFILQDKLRAIFGVPAFAAIFLIINGFILLKGDKKEMQQKKNEASTGSMQVSNKEAAVKLNFGRAILMGIAQSFSLLAGISRSGVTMVTGLYSGLSIEAAARFSFMLATPIIFLAGIYKLPELLSSSDRSILGPTAVGAVIAGVAAYFSVRFLDKYFQNKRMLPFAIYCFAFGGFMLIYQIFFQPN
jgi:undecaprenyl-diphosphatase